MELCFILNIAALAGCYWAGIVWIAAFRKKESKEPKKLE